MQQFVGVGPGTIDRPHEESAQQAEDGHLYAVGSTDDGPIATGCRARVVGRLHDILFTSQDGVDFLSPVNVIAHRDAVDTRGDQFLVDFRCQSRSAGGVFGIGHNQVDRLLHAQAAHHALYDLLARFSDDVTDQQDFHVGG